MHTISSPLSRELNNASLTINHECMRKCHVGLFMSSSSTTSSAPTATYKVLMGVTQNGEYECSEENDHPGRVCLITFICK